MKLEIDAFTIEEPQKYPTLVEAVMITTTIIQNRAFMDAMLLRMGLDLLQSLELHNDRPRSLHLDPTMQAAIQSLEQERSVVIRVGVADITEMAEIHHETHTIALNANLVLEAERCANAAAMRMIAS